MVNSVCKHRWGNHGYGGTNQQLGSHQTKSAATICQKFPWEITQIILLLLIVHIAMETYGNHVLLWVWWSLWKMLMFLVNLFKCVGWYFPWTDSSWTNLLGSELAMLAMLWTSPYYHIQYPLVMTNIAIELGHRNSEFSHLEFVIFHTDVSLPEGIWIHGVESET